jgi:hypothetical protein
MKKYTIIISICVILLILGILLFENKIATTKENDSKVSLEISPEFPTYLKLQTVNVKIAIKNNSDVDYLLNQSFSVYGNVDLAIEKPDGTLYEYKVTDRGGTYPTPIVVKPGETYESYGELSNYMYELNQATGTYSIKGTYQDLISKPVTFQVVEPNGTEKKVYDQVYEIRKNFLNATEKVQNIHAASLQLAQEYPQSVYAPQLYMTAFVTKPQTDESMMTSLVDKYFENNANSYHSQTVVAIYGTYLQRQQLDAITVEDKLSTIATKYSGTKAEFFINRFLNTIKK